MGATHTEELDSQIQVYPASRCFNVVEGIVFDALHPACLCLFSIHTYIVIAD